MSSKIIALFLPFQFKWILLYFFPYHIALALATIAMLNRCHSILNLSHSQFVFQWETLSIVFKLFLQIYFD